MNFIIKNHVPSFPHNGTFVSLSDISVDTSIENTQIILTYKNNDNTITETFMITPGIYLYKLCPSRLIIKRTEYAKLYIIGYERLYKLGCIRQTINGKI